MLKNIQLTIALTLAITVLCISAIIVHLHTWNFVAHKQGYDTFIYYQGRGFKCKTFTPTEKQKEWRRIYAKYEKEIEKGEPFPEKERLVAIECQINFDEALRSFIADGIFFLLSIIGLILLWFKRKNVLLERANKRLSLLSWLSILITLYCHWFIRAFVVKLIMELRAIDYNFESWISWLAKYFQVSGWITIANCLFSLSILAYLMFRVIPRRQLMPFLIAGLAGGVLSYWIWYSWLGPIIMPFT